MCVVVVYGVHGLTILTPGCRSIVLRVVTWYNSNLLYKVVLNAFFFFFFVKHGYGRIFYLPHVNMMKLCSCQLSMHF